MLEPPGRDNANADDYFTASPEFAADSGRALRRQRRKRPGSGFQG